MLKLDIIDTILFALYNYVEASDEDKQICEQAFKDCYHDRLTDADCEKIKNDMFNKYNLEQCWDEVCYDAFACSSAIDYKYLYWGLVADETPSA